MEHITFLYFSLICLTGAVTFISIFFVYLQTGNKLLLFFLIFYSCFTIYLLLFTLKIYIDINLDNPPGRLVLFVKLAENISFATLFFSIAFFQNRFFYSKKKLLFMMDSLFAVSAFLCFLLQTAALFLNDQKYHLAGFILFLGLMIYVITGNGIIFFRKKRRSENHNMPPFLIVCFFTPLLVFDFFELLKGKFYFFPFLYTAFGIFMIIHQVRKYFSEMRFYSINYSEDTLDDFFNDHGISAREREILRFVREGRSNQEIGERLFISTHTVKTHLRNIYRKTGLESRYKLIREMSSITER